MFSPLNRSRILNLLLLLIVLAVLSLLVFISRYQQRLDHHTTRMKIDYYVSLFGSDRNDGSQAHPFLTIQKAADVAVPGTTVHVAPGNYPQNIVSKASGAATTRIVFVSDIKWGARIKTAGAEYIWANYGDYVDIVGFDVTGDGSAREGIINWGSYVRVISNHVHDLSMNDVGCSPHGGAGINQASETGHDNDTIGNIVHDIGPLHCDGTHGIYHANLRGHILNNIVYQNAEFGIHTFHHSTDVVIANNLVFANHGGGILVGASEPGDPTGLVADNFLVTNNIIVYNARYGIDVYGKVGTHNRYLNNLFYGNPVDMNLNNDNIAQGTIDADPQFVNYQPDGSGDYHLKPTSPAIDAGTSIGAPPTDIDGNPRPQGRGYDIGPHEYQFSSPTPTRSSGNFFLDPVVIRGRSEESSSRKAVLRQIESYWTSRSSRPGTRKYLCEL